VTYAPRHLAAAVRRALRTFPAVLVTGARQTGKTTLLRHEFGGRYDYVSLERPDTRARALADPQAFLDEYRGRLIIDEIQRAPILLHYLKDRIDDDRSPGRWLLTGSQTFALMKGVSQSLAGRVAVLSLEPLSMREVAGALQPETPAALCARVFNPGARHHRPTIKARALDEWLLRGGYPEPRLNRRVDRDLWFSSYVQTYLERDVRDLLRVGDLEAFRQFLFLVGTRTGQLLNLAELGREIGITAPSARQWLSVLQASHIVHLLRPYHRNLGKRIRKSPKLYLLDTGLATFLLGLHDRDAIVQGPAFGALVESAVVAEWVKAFRGAGVEPPLSFWRASDGREVDLIVEQGGRLYGLEVKATATPTPAHAEGLARWARDAGPSTRVALACRVEKPTALRPGIRAVPWHLAW
jgi:predicted AAA+ superfamily ATPase